jgi:predicted esterase
MEEEKEQKETNLEDPILSEEKTPPLSTKIKVIIITVSLILIPICIILIILLVKQDDENDDNTAPIIINPTDNYTYCLIWLHGLDNKPENYVDLFTKDIKLPHQNNTKIILMRAPIMKMSYNKKKVTSWFDISKFPIDTKDKYNFEDAKNSSNALKNVIDEEAELLKGHYENIFIGGHSQGACVSLYLAYASDYLLGGVLGCNGILFPQGEINGDKDSLNVYIGHGDKDLAFPIQFHNETLKRIENYTGLKRYIYEGKGHGINDQEKKDIEAFLNNTMV